MKYKSIYKIKLTGYLLWLFVTVTSCATDVEDNVPTSGEIMRVYTSVAGRGEASALNGQGEELYARLLFWEDEDYHDMLENETTAWETPFLNIVLDEEIDYYQVNNNIPFNTKHSYPSGQKQVHVMGYAPAELTSDDNYKTLSIPENLQNGKIDFLSGDGNRYRVGSSAAPFEIANGEIGAATLEQKQLEFCHLTSKILVLATRHENMRGKIGVRKVSVTLHEQKVPTLLEWRTISSDGEAAESGGYFPTEPSDKKNILLTNTSTDPIVLGMEQRVDSCYVYPTEEDDTHYHKEVTTKTDEIISLTMDVKAELMPFNTSTGNWEEDKAQERIWTNVQVGIKSVTEGKLKMGYMYKIIITFDIYDIHLQGVEMEWDWGGKHYIPITPTENKR